MFYTVVRNREDGDYDTIAAFSTDEEDAENWANEIMEYCEHKNPEDKFNILTLQNVDEIISQEIIGLENTYEKKAI